MLLIASGDLGTGIARGAEAGAGVAAGAGAEAGAGVAALVTAA
ncbi:hypothetical protein [Streptomyces sp. NPDC058486]